MKIKFARFGGLSSVNQREYDSNHDGFHSPPARRGFYAFVWPHYEFFLLGGGKWTNYAWSKGAKFSYVRDNKGNIIDDKHPEYDKLTEGYKYWSIPTKAWDANREEWNKMDVSYDDPLYEKLRDELDAKWESEHPNAAKWVLVQKPSPKIFEYKGNIWHHLKHRLGACGVLKEKGGWTLSPFDDYVEALKKDMQSARTSQSKGFGRTMPFSTKNPYLGICKDHLEVFIEKL